MKSLYKFEINLSAAMNFFLSYLSNNSHHRLSINFSGPPVEVGVTMYVLSISSVSEVLMVHPIHLIYLITVKQSKRNVFKNNSVTVYLMFIIS